jgi:dolichyl-diphosphooligosaccharide--protein glycosyltransferase
MTDDWARDSVYNYIKSQIKSEIDKQYPNLPDANKNTLINNQFNELLKTQKNDIDAQIKAVSQEFKKHFKDENEYTYLLAIDPYYFLRHARNYLDYGIAGTKLVGGEGDWTDQMLMYPHIDFSEEMSWDSQRMAPVGSAVKMSFHDYAIVYLYKIMHFFNKNVNLMRAAFLIPVLISALSVIPAFFLGKKVGGNLGGFFAALIVGIHAAFINRTVGGFSDTDAYNVFFPLIIAWIFFEAFDTLELKRKIGLGALTGILIGIYSFAWKGWWYIAGFVFATIAIYFIYLVVINQNIIKKNLKDFFKLKTVKNTLISIGSVIGTFILFSLFFNLTLISNLVLQPINFMKIKAVAITTIWPNIQTTVAELNPASLSTTINQIGGKFLFLIAVIGIIITFLKKEKQEGKTHIKYGILLTIWFFATIYASTKGLRFILLLVPAFAVAFGVACGIVFNYVTKWAEKEIKIDKQISKIIVGLLLALLLINPIRAGYATASKEIPSMNDAWWNSLTKIKEKSAPDAIINSWWDFGHWFITVANRSVTFDGAGQDTHMAYWIGRSILTSDEDLAAGILRMVDCGNNNAFYALNGVEKPSGAMPNKIDEKGVLNDTPKSIDILNKIVLMNKEDAKKELLKYVPEERADLVLKYTHCSPPEDYYITSEDMIGKSGVWAHFGSWDFNKALIYNTLKKKEYRNDREKSIEFLKQRFNYTEEIADQLYYDVQAITSDKDANNWIAPWPSYAGNLANCGVKNNIVGCNNGVNVNLTNYDAFILVNNQIVRPESMVYVEDDDLAEKKFNGTTAPYSVALIPKGNNSYSSVIMQPDLALSTFTRLFFFEGVGSRYFEFFSYERDITGAEIYVWKVDWEGKVQERKALERLKEKNEEDKSEISEDKTNDTVEIKIPIDISENNESGSA